MSQEISTAKAAMAPIPSTREFQDLLRAYRSRLEKRSALGRTIYSISDQAIPSPAEYSALRERRGMLAAVLNGSQQSEVERRIIHLFYRFPGSRLPDGAVDAVMGAYARDLTSFPLWAVEAGVVEFIQRGGEFAPSSPELRQTIERQVVEVCCEVAEIDSVLTADVWHEPSDEEKARVRERFEKLVADLKLREPFPKQGRAQDADQRPSEPVPVGEAGGRPAPALSPELAAAIRKKMGFAEASNGAGI